MKSDFGLGRVWVVWFLLKMKSDYYYIVYSVKNEYWYGDVASWWC